jgi:hypothetical protein
MKWIPPIPYGTLYSKPALQLGHALPLLGWCYDNVTSDGWLELNLQEISGELDVPYRTLKQWWQSLRTSAFVADIQDRGRKGLRVRIADEWLDWRILEARTIKNGAENRPITQTRAVETVSERSVNGTNIGQENALEQENEPEMGRKWAGNGAEIRPISSMYKGTHDSQESESHETSPSPIPSGRRAPDRRMVMMLMAKGFKSPKVANEIASMGLDYQTVEESIDNLLADKTSIPAIIGFLQTNPPEPGQPYPRRRHAQTSAPTAPVIPEDVLTPAQAAAIARARRMTQ